MTQSTLIAVLGYIWAAFGACWLGAGMLQKTTADPGRQNTGRTFRLVFLATTFVLLFLGRHRIPPVALIILGLAWAMLATYWATLGKSASSSAEFRFYRLLRLLVLAATFTLLFWPATAIGVLGVRFIPAIPSVSIAGFGAALLGMMIALWARISLGRFWSDKVVLQSGHELIRIGPYSRMRHPIYSGVLLGVLGTAFVLGEWRGLLAFLLLLVNYAIKARKEEHLLATQFGPGFEAHAARTGFLFPRLRPASR